MRKISAKDVWAVLAILWVAAILTLFMIYIPDAFLVIAVIIAGIITWASVVYICVYFTRNR